MDKQELARAAATAYVVGNRDEQEVVAFQPYEGAHWIDWAKLVLVDDEAATAAITHDLTTILTALTEDVDEQRSAVVDLIERIDTRRISGATFWDSGTGCGCAIGTLCHAVGVDADEPMSQAAALRLARTNAAFTHQYGELLSMWERGEYLRPIWAEAIRTCANAHATHLVTEVALIPALESGLVALAGFSYRVEPQTFAAADGDVEALAEVFWRELDAEGIEFNRVAELRDDDALRAKYQIKAEDQAERAERPLRLLRAVCEAWLTAHPSASA